MVQISCPNKYKIQILDELKFNDITERKTAGVIAVMRQVPAKAAETPEDMFCERSSDSCTRASHLHNGALMQAMANCMTQPTGSLNQQSGQDAGL